MSETQIQVEQVTKSFGTFCAVSELSFSLGAGEILGFLGVNGAGKTTTLRMLAGILRPDSGKISIGDYDLAKEPEKAKAITGYIPDRPYLYSKLTAREFLVFIADLYKVPVAKTRERVPSLLEEYGLLDWQHQLIEGFSHGMKQRLATAAALIHEPQVLIIDEPMVGLDPHGAKLLKEALRRYAKEGMAILLSTHSLNVAEELSDRVAIVHQGRLLATGTAAELRAQSGTASSTLEHAFLELTDPSRYAMNSWGSRDVPDSH